MDKLMNNHWSVKIIALLLALILYMSVNLDPDIAKNASNGNSSVTYDQETISEVPINVYYDSENTIVKGIPDSVNMVLEGPKSILQPTKLQRDFEVYVDLTDMQLGSHKVKVKYRNISEKLEVKIEPQTLIIEIEEKVSKTFPVEVDVNLNNIRDGYITEQPIVNPSVVKIVGAKSEIEQVAYVKAIVGADDISETVEEEITVIALDKRLNKLNVDIAPRSVNVKVPVVSPSKKVGIKIKVNGTLPEGLTIKSIVPSPNEVTVYGPKEILADLNTIENVGLDVSKLTKSGSVSVDVPVPKGANRVYPEEIDVQIELEDEGNSEGEEQAVEKRMFENLPLSFVGKSQSFYYQFLLPKMGKLDMEVMGPSSVLNNLQQKDIQLSVNVQKLSSGDHDVPIEVKVPQNVNYVLALNKSRVRITEKQEDSDNESDPNNDSEENPNHSLDNNEQG